MCEHIHLPLQSGSSRILKAMRRTYDRGRYLDRVALIREHVPDAALSTDIIVGFPGETEEDFEQTLEVVEEVGFDSAFTFLFSPRRGTAAAEISEGVVPHPVKVERMERLLDIVQRRAHERAQRFVGRTLEVLVEGPSAHRPGAVCGVARATTRSSTSADSRRPERWRAWRSTRPRARRSRARSRSPPGRPDEDPRGGPGAVRQPAGGRGGGARRAGPGRGAGAAGGLRCLPYGHVHGLGSGPLRLRADGPGTRGGRGGRALWRGRDARVPRATTS